ncbi:MAG: YHS domain-containing protein [Actinobacteria bacterium]|nr:YHS domain-containing protein [Actinomycetota bacterium]MSW21868.1 YHS domain-containing protein [Actinomycetota bacterium]MSX03679.1 YHS domain-containing protein [Actinomycetota bacterium]MSX60980.1 YHS domain-containing protein [Actinomycetota bacterium]MSX84018.1 YHS domain-containing protein [Actinomycetota bacterium]
MNSISDGLIEAWWMFFHTFWALVLGFTLSGAVQAFISRKAMKEQLGDDSFKSISKASFFGIVSSSCSYSASALAKSLFSKGANFTASMVFMFASTNLVIELGLVLWVLMGWQFAVAEFIGGAIMILLLKLLIPVLIPERMIAASRENIEMERQAGSSKKATWHDAAGYTIGDFKMLRVELIVGFLVAGLAAKLIPTSFWGALFLSGNGLFSSIENAIIGPFIAFISFVCSVGNVPLASALWHGGLSFGGTISFIFADLIALPLVLIYRKYYGTKLAIRLTLVFWLVMSLSGFITELIFQLLGQIPVASHSMSHSNSIGWNYTTVLDVIALIVIIWVYWMYRTRLVEGDDQEFAKDWVCGMQVRISDAPANFELNGKAYYFCMPGCKESFAADPGKFISVDR